MNIAWLVQSLMHNLSDSGDEIINVRRYGAPRIGPRTFAPVFAASSATCCNEEKSSEAGFEACVAIIRLFDGL